MLIVVFDVFEQTVLKDACSFSTELGKLHIQNMYFIYPRHKYNIL